MSVDPTIIWCMGCNKEPGSPYYCAKCQKGLAASMREARTRVLIDTFRRVGLPNCSLPTKGSEQKSQIFYALDPRVKVNDPAARRLAAALLQYGDAAPAHQKDWWSGFLWSTASKLLDRLNPEHGDLNIDNLTSLEGLGIAELGHEHHTAWRDQIITDTITRRVESDRLTFITTTMPKQTLQDAYGTHGPRLLAALDEIGWTEVT